MKDSSVSEHTRESFKTSPLIMETSLSIAVKCDLVSEFSNIRNLITLTTIRLFFSPETKTQNIQTTKLC